MRVRLAQTVCGRFFTILGRGYYRTKFTSLDLACDVPNRPLTSCCGIIRTKPHPGGVHLRTQTEAAPSLADIARAVLAGLMVRLERLAGDIRTLECRRWPGTAAVKPAKAWRPSPASA